MSVPTADQIRLSRLLSDDLQLRINWAYNLEQEIAVLSGGGLTAWGLASQATYVHNGDPNGLVTAVSIGDFLIDVATPALWIAAGAGTVWTQATGGGGGAVASVNGQTGVVVLAAADVGADASGAAAAAQAASQPLDSDLTAIAALSTTAFGRSVLTQANAAALRTLAGTVIGTNVQAWDADLDTLAANITAFGQSLVDDANAATARTTLGLGTAATNNTGDFDASGAAAAAQAASQPLDSDLTAIAALSTTSYGRGLLTLASAAADLAALSGQATADFSLNSHKITNVTDPTSAQDAATKQYVDAAIQGLSPKPSVLTASTANLTLSGEQTIDGQLTSTSRVLVKNQTAPAENGIYVTAAGAWARATDMDAPAEVPGAFVFVEKGTAQGATGWTVASGGPFTIGVTSIVWTQFSGAGTYSAGTGISLTGSAFSIDTAVTVDKTTAQTLTNKTLTSPALTTPTGIVATDIASGTFAIARIPTGTDGTHVPLGGVITGAGPTGDASHTLALTYNAAGQLTAVTNNAIAIAESQVTNLVSDLAAKATSTLASGHFFVGNVSNVATDDSTLITTATTLTGSKTFLGQPGTAGTHVQYADFSQYEAHATAIAGDITHRSQFFDNGYFWNAKTKTASTDVNGAQTVPNQRTVTDMVTTAPVTAVTATTGGSTTAFGKTAHGLANGTAVVLAGITNITGVSNGTVYYVVNTAANTFGLSATSGGGAITLGGTNDSGLTASVATVTSATAAFTANDVGAFLTGSADLPAAVTVLVRNSSTSIVMSAGATAGHTAQTLTITGALVVDSTSGFGTNSNDGTLLIGGVYYAYDASKTTATKFALAPTGGVFTDEQVVQEGPYPKFWSTQIWNYGGGTNANVMPLYFFDHFDTNRKDGMMIRASSYPSGTTIPWQVVDYLNSPITWVQNGGGGLVTGDNLILIKSDLVTPLFAWRLRAQAGLDYTAPSFVVGNQANNAWDTVAYWGSGGLNLYTIANTLATSSGLWFALTVASPGAQGQRVSGTVTNGSAIVSAITNFNPSLWNIVGAAVTGTGIPGGTTISSIGGVAGANPTTSFTMSANGNAPGDGLVTITLQTVAGTVGFSGRLGMAEESVTNTATLCGGQSLTTTGLRWDRYTGLNFCIAGTDAGRFALDGTFNITNGATFASTLGVTGATTLTTATTTKITSTPAIVSSLALNVVRVYGAARPGVQTQRFNGSSASPTAVTSGQGIGGFYFSGATDSAGSTNPGAAVLSNATENFGSGSGAQLLFQTVPNTTLTLATALTLDQDQSATFAGNVTMTDAKNIAFGTTTGTKIGTATNQKLGFFNATPVVQQTSAAVAPAGGTGATAGAYDTAAHRDAAITLINAMRTTLLNLGLMA